MIYAAIDVNMLTHEKALAAGPEAMGLWTWGMCYAQQHATDGRLPRIAVLSAWGGRRNVMLAKRLVLVALWSENPDGSWAIFNYEKKNQRADDIERRRQAARDRYNRWKLQRSGSEQTRLQRVVDPEANAFATNAQTHVSTTTITRSDHDQDQDLDQGGAGGEPEPPAPPTPKVKDRRKPETPCPPSGAQPSEVAGWAAGWKIPIGHREFPNFLDHHRKKDSRWRDWAAAWRTWERNADKYTPRGAYAPPPPPERETREQSAAFAKQLAARVMAGRAGS